MTTASEDQLFELACMLGESTVLYACRPGGEHHVLILFKGGRVNYWSLDPVESARPVNFYLCVETPEGKFRPVTHLFIPFDKERAPLTNNLLVYSNGKILWDNVKLAQMEKN